MNDDYFSRPKINLLNTIIYSALNRRSIIKIIKCAVSTFTFSTCILYIILSTSAEAQTRKILTVIAKPGSGIQNPVLPVKDSMAVKLHRAGNCYLYLDNFTGYYVDVWVETEYLGRLSPYARAGRFDVTYPSNWTHWSAKTIRGTYNWHSDSYCNDSRVFNLVVK